MNLEEGQVSPSFVRRSRIWLSTAGEHKGGHRFIGAGLAQLQESGVEVEVDEDDVRGPLAEKPGELGTIGGDAVLVAAVSQDELQHLREWVVHDDHDARPRNRWARVRHEVFSLSRPRDGAFMAVARSVRATMNGVRGRTPALRTVTGLARPNPASERRGLIGGDPRWIERVRLRRG